MNAATEQLRALTVEESKAKTAVIIAYALLSLGVITGGLFGIIAIIYVFLKNKDVKHTLFADHFSKIKRMFFWSIVWGIIGVITLFIIVGYFILIALGIYCLYVIVKGLIQVFNNAGFHGAMATEPKPIETIAAS